MSRPRALLQLTKPISVIRAANKGTWQRHSSSDLFVQPHLLKLFLIRRTAADEAARKLKEESKQEENKNALQQLLGGYSDSEGEEEKGEKEEEEKGKAQNSGMCSCDHQLPYFYTCLAWHL